MKHVPQVLTIGHSNHPFPDFLALVKASGVDVIVDVRSSPFSRTNPQYNRRSLARMLRANGIRYLFLGNELGARPSDPSCFVNGRVSYSLLARTDAYERGIARVRKGATVCRLALMCAEKEPLNCHRTILVARSLEEGGIVVKHILANGHLESHSDTMRRLITHLRLDPLEQDDLFRPQSERIAEAYRIQSTRIAFVNKRSKSAKPRGKMG